MSDTGRLRAALRADLRDVVYRDAEQEAALTLPHLARVDAAHVVMLAETGLIPGEAARAVLAVIDGLAREGFVPVLERPMPRGLFLAYEAYLVEAAGMAAGGALQTGRSRNDLGATLFKLRLRDALLALLDEGTNLMAALLKAARRARNVPMPLYTHGQPAVPTTYGTYLAAVAVGLERGLAALAAIRDDLDVCPLGACAGGGTALPVAPLRVARLLGFLSAAENPIDAVASRDSGLAALAAAARIGLVLTRFAADLAFWTTAEAGLVALPDDLCGSSSAMPQKKNPFLLELLKGRSGSATAAFVGATLAMQGTPYTNSVAVGTEGAAAVWPALRDVEGCLRVATALVEGAELDRAAAIRRAQDGHTAATELANRLVTRRGQPFREAHHRVGDVVRIALEADLPLDAAWRRHAAPEDRELAEGLSVGRLAQAVAVAPVALDRLERRRRALVGLRRRLDRRWNAEAGRELAKAQNDLAGLARPSENP